MLGCMAIYVKTSDVSEYSVKPPPDVGGGWDEDGAWAALVDVCGQKAWLNVVDDQGRDCVVNERRIVAMRRGV